MVPQILRFLLIDQMASGSMYFDTEGMEEIGGFMVAQAQYNFKTCVDLSIVSSGTEKPSSNLSSTSRT